MTNLGSKYLQRQLHQERMQSAQLRQQLANVREEKILLQQRVLGICTGSVWQIIKKVKQLRKDYKSGK